MNRILSFVREKAFVLILLGSVIAAAGTGIWAMNTVQKSLDDVTTPEDTTLEEFEGFEALEGDTIWDEDAAIVTDEMNGEIAMDEVEEEASEEAVVLEPGNPSDGSPAPEEPSESSTDSSGSSLLSELLEPSASSTQQEDTVTPSFVLPVSGAMVQAFSGDELVYSETLGDWRTHNGTDYAAYLGEEVIAPVSGEIISVYTDGNWGGVVELQDAEGNVWRFCGVENCPLQVGEAVSVPMVIGYIGIISAESGMDTHLHLEILVDGAYQDPADYLK